MKKVLILILAMVLSFSVFALAACQTPCETHVDANHDGICDVCATENLPVVHADSNHDGKCDVCAADYREACADVNPLDGKCDVCGAAVAHTCVDTATVDGKCDICGADVAHTHVDAMHDGKCDICGTTVEVKHVDNNHDGVCDVCQASDLPYEHVDADTNFKCDVCGKVLEHDCVDANTDCWCDICEAAMHADNNHDGFCDVCDTSTGEPEHVYVEGVCSCGAKEEWLVTLEAAQDFLRASYIEEPTRTAGDFKVLAQVPAGEGFLPVTWTVELVSGGNADSVKVGTTEGTEITIEIDEEQMDVYYKLIGTVTDSEGRKLSVSFDRELPNYNLVNWEDYVAAPIDYTLSVQGVVTALTGKSVGNTYNTIYIQDNDGGYYIYDMASDPVADGIKVGMTIKVRGTKDIYSGTHEVKEAVAEIVDQTIKTIEPVDYTTIYTNAQSLKAEDLVAKQGFLVTIKGVQITGQNLENGYFKFKLGDLESYIRISGSVCPLSKDAQTKFKADHSSHFGWTANATGVICVYDGAFYLTPVNANAFEYTALPELDEAGEVAFEKGALTFIETIGEDSAIELPAKGVSYADVTIAWDFKAETAHDCASIADGKLHVELPSEATTITLVATLTSGSVTDTLEITIKVDSSKIDWNVTADALATCETLENGATTEDFFYFYGTVGEIYNTQYCNFYLLDEEGNSIIVYGLYAPNGTDRYGSKREIAEIPFKEGDLICMHAKVQKYYKSSDGSITPELVSAVHIETPEKGTETFVAYNATEAVEIANSLENGATTEEYAYFSGIVGEIYNTQYCNFYLTDANGGSIIVYGLYAPNETDRYGSKREIAEIPFKEGDIIVLRSKVQKYYKSSDGSITPELVSAVLVSFYTPAHTCESVCEICKGCLDAECTEEACATKCSCVETDAPEAGTYVVEMYQSKKEINLYLTGEESGYYLATSESSNNAMTVTLAKLENGKYTIQLANGKYLAMAASGTHINAVMQETACEFTWNAKLGNFTVAFDGTEYFFGNYGDYTSIGTCKLSYASTNYQAKLVAPLAHICESVCETCKGCLDAECTEAACTTKCTCPPPHECESVCPICEGCTDSQCTEKVCATKCECIVVDATKLTAGQLVANAEIVEGTGVYATTPSDEKRLVVDGSTASIDGFSFTQRIKLGGSMKVSGGVVTDSLKLELTGACKIVLYVKSGSSSADRTLRIAKLVDDAFVSLEQDGTALATSVSKIEYTVDEAGTYYIGSAKDGINIYYIAISYKPEAPATLTASKTIAELIASEGWTNSTTKQTFNLDENVTVKVDGGSNSGKAYEDHIRIYATDSPAGTLTISVPEGYELVSVKVSTKTGTYAYLYVDGTTTDICNQTVEISGSSVVLNSVKNGSDGKQVRVTAIEVVYAPAK